MSRNCCCTMILPLLSTFSFLDLVWLYQLSTTAVVKFCSLSAYFSRPPYSWQVFLYDEFLYRFPNPSLSNLELLFIQTSHKTVCMAVRPPKFEVVEFRGFFYKKRITFTQSQNIVQERLSGRRRTSEIWVQKHYKYRH